MCLSPILIRNPYKGKKISSFLRDPLFHLHDIKALYIPVPCGKCAECTQRKQLYLVQRSQMEALDNYQFMVTLTYSNNMVPCLVINGYRHLYPDYHDIQNCIKRIRKHYADDPLFRPFRYCCASEYGGKTHRPHFHLLLSVPKHSSDTASTPFSIERLLRIAFMSEWKRNISLSTKKPVYKPLSKFIVNKKGRTFDLHYITTRIRKDASISDGTDVAFYVSKYINKFDSWFQKKQVALKINLKVDEFHFVMSRIAPRVRLSKGYGNPDSELVRSYIRSSIDSSKSLKTPDGYNVTYLSFRSPADGRYYPLSPYYKSKFATLIDMYDLYYNSNDPYSIFVDTFRPQKDYSDTDYRLRLNRSSDRLNAISARNGDFQVVDNSFTFDDLFTIYETDLFFSPPAAPHQPVSVYAAFDDFPELSRLGDLF